MVRTHVGMPSLMRERTQSTFPQEAGGTKKLQKTFCCFSWSPRLVLTEAANRRALKPETHEAVCFQAALPQQQLDKSTPRFSTATTVATAKTELKDLIHRARKPK